MRGITFHFRPNKNILGFAVGRAKAIVIRPVIKKPKKPNSANRKCVIVRLPSGKEAIAYVPGKKFTVSLFDYQAERKQFTFQTRYSLVSKEKYR